MLNILSADGNRNIKLILLLYFLIHTNCVQIKADLEKHINYIKLNKHLKPDLKFKITGCELSLAT